MIKAELEFFFDRLWPICRSITGNGLRESFSILQEIVPFELEEVPTGTSCFDWVIPEEWNITEAWIMTPDGNKIADFSINNLHVVNYSAPFVGELGYAELLPHLHYNESLPDAIPYYTSYYKRQWGFCISYRTFLSLPKIGKYKVCIKSTLSKGSLTYGQAVLKGEESEEIIFSSYLCHPSMANNELSGPLALCFLYQYLSTTPNRRYTYRFILAPETIGVIAFLSKYGIELSSKVKAGFVITCCGDKGQFTYQRSKFGNSLSDMTAEHVLSFCGSPFSVREFRVGGSDERQYCSPGFNWPMGSLMRTPYACYPEYHTSADNKDFINFDSLLESIEIYKKICSVLEFNRAYKGKVQYGEPHLAKYNLVPDAYEPNFNKLFKHRLLHFLSFADGSTDLIQIANRRNESVLEYFSIVDICRENGLIDE